MEYIVEATPSASIVRFDGDLSASSDTELRKMFVTLRQGDHLKVAADMNRVSFLDSTALGTLVWGMKNLREAGGDLRLFGLKDALQRLFSITSMDKAFSIFDSESDALGSYDG